MHYFDRLTLKSTTICYQKILIIATHLATFLLCVILLVRNFKKHALADAFYHILHKNSIGQLLRTSQDYFSPPPSQDFRKEMDNIYVHFRRVFVEFVVLLTKIWPTNIDF